MFLNVLGVRNILTDPNLYQIHLDPAVLPANTLEVDLGKKLEVDPGKNRGVETEVNPGRKRGRNLKVDPGANLETKSGKDQEVDLEAGPGKNLGLDLG